MAQTSLPAFCIAAACSITPVVARGTEPTQPVAEDPRHAPRCARWSARAVFESEDRHASRASLVSTDGTRRSVRMGDALEGSVVAGISFHSRRLEPIVWLWDGNALCQVNRTAPPERTPVIRRASPRAHRRAESWEAHIDRAALDDALGRLPEELSHGVRIEREFDPRGFLVAKITGVGPGSFLDRLGLQDGDRVVDLNGDRITAPEVVLRHYARLRTADHHTVGIERDGEVVRLSLRIQ